MADARFEYDLAFSFLAQDEALAQQIADLVSERFNVFIYSEQQKSLAGTDGEKSFNKIFGEKSRLVCVLYRPGWGESRWTRIEQTAIRNRAYEEGYDFCVFVVIDRGELPKWIPKIQLWFDLQRFGIKGAAAVLEENIQKFDGEPRIETPVGKAQRLRRQADFKRERSHFLQSLEGVDASNEELNSLFESVKTVVSGVNAELPRTLELRVSGQHDTFDIHGPGSWLTVRWSRKFQNSLTWSGLHVNLWRAAKFEGGTEEKQDWRYDFDRIASGSLGWRDSNDPDRFFTSKDLADHFVKAVLDNR